MCVHVHTHILKKNTLITDLATVAISICNKMHRYCLVSSEQRVNSTLLHNPLLCAIVEEMGERAESSSPCSEMALNGTPH